MHPRQRSRLSTLPNLYEFDRKPTVAATTTAEVTDEMIGLTPDPLAQTTAERLIRCAIAYRMMQDEKAEITRAAQRSRIMIAAAELEISVEIAEGISDELRRLTASSTTVPAGFTSRQSKPG